MKSTIWLILATTIVCEAYGLARGGDFRHASWQTYLILSTVLVVFTVAATCRTVADFRALAHWLIAASIYRGMMCWLSYFTWGRDVVGTGGGYLTTHDDTVLWVVSLLALIVHTVHSYSAKPNLPNPPQLPFL